MNRGSRKPDPRSGLTGSPLEQPTATLNPNRLSRSLRRTQTAAKLGSPSSQASEFKTPTRIPRSRSGFSVESPHNESDFQQDIIWDATSPSPSRLGKRGRKHAAGVVNISEIVSRIAPKHGRPEAAEPTLQQWIGDSATIPCTPDVQAPKPKKKSPRPNGVDDLLKLAKQFDFNMFRQDEEDVHQQSLELLAGDVLGFESCDPSLHGTRRPAVSADVQARLHRHPEDDLDFLFDGPTQHVSGSLSQVSSAQPSQVKPALTSSSQEAPGKRPAAGVSATNTADAAANDEFQDDWENDDLLNDSLVLEMTQNPLSFTAPKHCSTQKPPRRDKGQSSADAPTGRGLGLGPSAVFKAEKDNVSERATFKLQSNPNFSVRRIRTDARTDSEDYSSDAAGKDTRSSFSHHRGFSGEAGSQRAWQTSSTAKSQLHQRMCAASSVSAAPASSTSPAAATPELGSAHIQPAAASDPLDEDLDSLFSLDLGWDDPADDDLLCEMCEDLENQIQTVENKSTRAAPLSGPTSSQRAALQPSNRTWDNRRQHSANQQPLPQKQTFATVPGASGRPAGSLAGVPASGLAAGAQVYRCTQTCQQGSSRAPSAAAAPRPPPGNSSKHQFTFKKPNNPVSTVTSKALGQCSAAEIELKKQQAMERRRQRLQAAQGV